MTTQTRQIRRELTFPGQPITVEELVSMDNDDFHYGYKWHQGQLGEDVRNYIYPINNLQIGPLNVLESTP